MHTYTVRKDRWKRLPRVNRKGLVIALAWLALAAIVGYAAYIMALDVSAWGV
jgi:hypothetical protein